MKLALEILLSIWHLSELTFAFQNHLVSGKWHLGHREPYLPTNQGFDSWFGIPYHMSGGSVDNHVCNADDQETMWLPLFANRTIVEQPVRLDDLATRYAQSAVSFIRQNAVVKPQPFFLYMAFSHVHQLCAPRDFPEQSVCQWAEQQNATFATAVKEMDWIAGQILDALDATGAANNTLVLFTSDNGPWVAEQSCSGSKGPFTGKWLQQNVDTTCTACPHDYIPSPTPERPRRCVLPGSKFELEGVHCGEDTGLGSLWEANLRMPALARFPDVIPPNTSTQAMISTLDVIPTFLSLINKPLPVDLDGIDRSDYFLGKPAETTEERILFFWRDGFRDGPLGPPFGRFDVAAARLGNLKAWFWTKSAHYNDDVEQFHDPPLLFDVIKDPAESQVLDPTQYTNEIRRIKEAVDHHKKTVDWNIPLALASDPSYLPCIDRLAGCRTHPVDFLES